MPRVGLLAGEGRASSQWDCNAEGPEASQRRWAVVGIPVAGRVCWGGLGGVKGAWKSCGMADSLWQRLGKGKVRVE